MQTNVAELPLADRLWVWFDNNRKPAIWSAIFVLVVGLGIWFFFSQRLAREMAAGNALSNVAVEQHISGTQPDAAGVYLNIASRFPATSAGTRAALLAAGAMFTQGKFTEAQAQFQSFAREHGDSPYVGEALLGVAACLDAEGKSAEATAAYKELVDRHPSETFIPQAKFSLAYLYEKQGKPELARGLYEEVEMTDRYGYLGSEAGMRLEELKAKFPKLFPSAPTPAAPQYRIEKQ